MTSQQAAQEQLLRELKEYQPFDKTEALEKQRCINFLEHNTNIYSRDNLTGHITSSSWIVNKTKTKALLIHHNIYKCRAPLWGHADNQTDLPRVAVEEAKEESGIQNIRILSKDILDVVVLPVVSHTKNGYIVPEHFHFDIRYLLEADDTDALIVKKDEVSAVQRFYIEDIPNLHIDIMSTIERVIKKVHNTL